jgi:hypothetical protein
MATSNLSKTHYENMQAIVRDMHKDILRLESEKEDSV